MTGVALSAGPIRNLSGSI